MKLSRQEIAVIAITVAMFLVVGSVFVAIFGVYTNGFNEKYSSIYLTSGKTKFYGESDAVELGNVQFKVHNAWTSNRKYKVQVLPTGEDFYYQVDGRWYSYLDTVKELTPAFRIIVDGSKFTIYANSVPMRLLLSALAGYKDVEIASDDVDITPHYKLVVSTEDGKHSVSITFRCRIYIPVDDVELPPSLLI